jgi:hypothetical protein
LATYHQVFQIDVSKMKRMRLYGHISRAGEMINAYEMLLRALYVDGGTVLKRILNACGLEICTEFVCKILGYHSSGYEEFCPLRFNDM